MKKLKVKAIEIDEVESGFVNGRNSLLSVRDISKAAIYFVIPSQVFERELQTPEYVSPGQFANDPEGISDNIYGSENWVVIDTIQSGIQGLFFWHQSGSGKWEPTAFVGKSNLFELIGSPSNYDGGLILLVHDYEQSRRMLLRLPKTGQPQVAIVASETQSVQVESNEIILSGSKELRRVPLN